MPALPIEIDRDCVARDSRFRSGHKPLSAEQAVDQRRLAGIGPSDHGDADGLVGGVGGRSFMFFCIRRCLRQRRTQGVIQVGHSLPVLGANRHRIAEAERIRFERAGFTGPPLALVGHENRWLARPAHTIGKGAVGRCCPGAGVDQEKDGIGLLQRNVGLRLHFSGKSFGGGLFKPCCIDHPKRQAAQLSFALAPVAGYARLIMDERPARADQPVEQGRFSHIGSTDYGDRKGHEFDLCATALRNGTRAALSRTACSLSRNWASIPTLETGMFC